MNVLRRSCIVLAFALTLVAVLQGPARATCMLAPMKQVTQESDAVWWAHVTDAEVANWKTWSGAWELSVRLDDVLKGPGEQGGSATVIASQCGPATTLEVARERAPSFIGPPKLFIGDIDKDGTLVAFSEVLLPQGLTPEEQYRQARFILGPSPTAPDVNVPHNFPWSLGPWFLSLLAVLAAVVVVVALLWRAHRRHV